MLAQPLLCIQRGPASADAIIVLGGESERRPEQAMHLFRSGSSPRVVISGDGHKGDIETYLLRHGITETSIQLEPYSQNTKENAEFTCLLLKSNQVASAIIVTSWFHSRRSLACFQHFGPGIRFSSLPTMKHEPFRIECWRILKEYLKIGWYTVRYQIPPWA
ncbi:MAG TPA: YdcF family protein [Candidatus Saccharimonadales bacterium]|nr:YdcF family protein [Candidatus Saccharimonadales bacterium]